mgnify:CR=1 FL=1
MDTQSAAKLPFNLKIIPVNKDGIPMGVPFLAMFNPENITINEQLEWDEKNPPGAEGSDPAYSRTQPRTFTLEFTIDGTGVNTNATIVRSSKPLLTSPPAAGEAMG